MVLNCQPIRWCLCHAAELPLWKGVGVGGGGGVGRGGGGTGGGGRGGGAGGGGGGGGGRQQRGPRFGVLEAALGNTALERS